MNMFSIQQMYFGLYEKCKKMMISRYVRKVAKGYTSPSFQLTKEQKRQILEFYKPYAKINLAFHRFFTEKSGEFSPYYLPNDMYINKVDEYFNNRTESQVMDNKCYYPMIFGRNGVKQAECVALRMNGFWFTPEQQMLTKEELERILNAEPALFVKEATRSYGGKGVQYIERPVNGDLFSLVMEKIHPNAGDIVVQKPLKQHPAFAAFNPSSVNTIRVVTLLSEDGVKVYSSVLKTGEKGSKVDNGTSGGMTVGITGDGKLRKYARKVSGEQFDRHPASGVVFENYELPCFDAVLELVKKAHPLVPHFRLVSWDVAVDENGDAVLIEANLAKGSINLHQLNNGPLFGEDTKKILDEVFGKNK